MNFIDDEAEEDGQNSSDGDDGKDEARTSDDNFLDDSSGNEQEVSFYHANRPDSEEEDEDDSGPELIYVPPLPAPKSASVRRPPSPRTPDIFVPPPSPDLRFSPPPQRPHPSPNIRVNIVRRDSNNNTRTILQFDVPKVEPMWTDKNRDFYHQLVKTISPDLTGKTIFDLENLPNRFHHYKPDDGYWRPFIPAIIGTDVKKLLDVLTTSLPPLGIEDEPDEDDVQEPPAQGFICSTRDGFINRLLDLNKKVEDAVVDIVNRSVFWVSSPGGRDPVVYTLHQQSDGSKKAHPCIWRKESLHVFKLNLGAVTFVNPYEQRTYKNNLAKWEEDAEAARSAGKAFFRSKPQQPKKFTLDQVWLKSLRRRTVQEIICNPSLAPEIEGLEDAWRVGLFTTQSRHFNRWQGLPYFPTPELRITGPMNYENTINIFTKHLERVICRDSQVIYQYVLHWLCFKLMFPHRKPGVALVLIGRQGIGKTLFGEIYCSLFGDAGLYLASAQQVTNTHGGALVSSKSLVVIDEFGWTENKIAKDILKISITGRESNHEPKYVDACQLESHCGFIFTGNDATRLPLDGDGPERRYCLMEADYERMKDVSPEYFGLLNTILEHEYCKEILTDYLLRCFPVAELDKYDFTHERPVTEELQELSNMMLLPLDAWWSGCLHNHYHPGVESGKTQNEGRTGWGIKDVSVTMLHEAFLTTINGTTPRGKTLFSFIAWLNHRLGVNLDCQKPPQHVDIPCYAECKKRHDDQINIHANNHSQMVPRKRPSSSLSSSSSSSSC